MPYYYIITAVYNEERTLEYFLDSLNDQTILPKYVYLILFLEK